MRRLQLPLLAATLLAVGLASPAAADHKGKTQPISGAVSLPAGTSIGSPFQKGAELYLTSGYSPDGGSSYHKGTNRTCCANDYYALDIILNNHANNGKGQPLVAIADGTVRKAGKATGGWSSYGLRVYIEHDFGDGHKYISLYAHMDSLDVSPGDTVEKGETIGTLGGSCTDDNGNVNKSCFGYHVHFALHRDSSIGGSGTGGSYGGNAVVPEPMDGHTGLHSGTTFKSKNDGGGGQNCVCSTDGKTETQMCGNCGQKERTCDGCQWSDWSSCMGEGVCAAGATEMASCQETGTQTRTCSEQCEWGSWSACQGGGSGGDTGMAMDTGTTDTGSGSDMQDTGTGGGDAGSDDAGTGSPPVVDTGGAGADAGGAAGKGDEVSTSSCSQVGGPAGLPGALMLLFALGLVGRVRRG